jgi:regulator of protease activity HflC (stomatin/prohibitin superfamily)
MKKVTVKHNQLALVSKNNELLRVLTAGNYYFFKSEVIEVFDINDVIESTVFTAEQLCVQPLLIPYIQVVKVATHQVATVSNSYMMIGVHTHGIYIYNAQAMLQFALIDIYTNKPIDTQQALLALGTPLEPYLQNIVVPYGNQALLFINNVYQHTLQAGTYYYYRNNNTLHIVLVDMRQKSTEISGQEILTADKVSLRINAIATYTIVDAYKAKILNNEAEKQVYYIIQMLLREHIGTNTLYQLLTDKQSISELINKELQAKVMDFGIQLQHCGIRDVILPGDVKDILNKVLIAEKKAEANAITRREETAATRSLLNTAKLMEDNAMLYKLKEMEYVERIAEKVSHIQLNGQGNVLAQLKDVLVK